SGTQKADESARVPLTRRHAGSVRTDQTRITSQMLQIRLIMNSPTEEILGFKTCCGLKMFDQNLEILVTNGGDRPVIVPSYFDLESEAGTERVTAVMPHGEHRIDPGDIMAFYCSMDESRWSKAQRLVFYDNGGNSYPIPIEKESFNEAADWESPERRSDGLASSEVKEIPSPPPSTS
ncbi:MAG: hypothetical protein ACOYXY_22770, partial [Thermodesulfobacteriota bacterium]